MPLLPSRETRRAIFNREDLFTLLCSAFFWGWCASVIWGDALFAPFEGVPNGHAVFFACVLMGSAAMLFIACFRTGKFMQMLDDARLELVFVLLAVAGCLCVAVGEYLSALLLVILGGLVIGATCAQFFLNWCRMFSRRGSKVAFYFFSGGITLGIIVDMLVALLVPLAALIVASLLPLVVLLFLHAGRKILSSDADDKPATVNERGKAVGPSYVTEAEEPPNLYALNAVMPHAKKGLLGFSPALFFPLVLFSVVIGILHAEGMLASSAGSIDFTSMPVHVFCGAIAAGFFLICFSWPSAKYNIIRIVFIVGIGCAVCAPFLGKFWPLDSLGQITLTIVFTTFLIAAWALFSEVSFATEINSVRVFAPGMLVIFTGILIGVLVEWLLHALIVGYSIGEGMMSVLAFVMVVSLVLLLVDNAQLWRLVKTEGQTATAYVPVEGESEIPSTQVAFEQKIARIAKEYGLTSREREVLSLFVTGRSRLRIADELSVSESTVASHLQHIYQKTDVHGRQGLIDLLD